MSSHPFFKDQLLRPEPLPQPDLSTLQAKALPPLPPIVQTSKPLISPVVGFAVGVAGLAAAAVAYYQLAQFVAKRNADAPPADISGPAIAGPDASGSSASGGGSAASTSSPASQNNPAGSSASRSTPGAGSRSAAPRRASSDAATSPAPVVTPGFVALNTPVPLQVSVGGQTRGTTSDGRVELPPGTHLITFANSLLEFRHTMTVTVQPGQSVALNVPLPNGLLSVNALPWADVVIDGKPVGTTPLANLALPIGTHEVVWRHPTLGERRQTVTVKAKTPARIGIEFPR